MPVEKVRREAGRRLRPLRAAPGEHVRRRGESIRAGSPLCSPRAPARRGRRRAGRPRGRGPDRRSCAAARDDRRHGQRARARPQPARARPARDSNGPMLAALCRARGAPRLPPRAVADEDAAVRRLFAEAGARRGPALTTGGVSAGDFDLLPAAAETRRLRDPLSRRRSCAPESPSRSAEAGRTLWFGLPGNPVSSVGLLPSLRRHGARRARGRVEPRPRVRPARLTRDVSVRGGRRDLSRRGSSSPTAASRGSRRSRGLGSHDLGRARPERTPCIRIPAGAAASRAGAIVECLLLRKLP